MTLALILFALAATGGLIMAVTRFGGRPQPSMALALVHGLAAAAGLVTLIAWIAKADTALATTAGLVLMLLAAVAGFLLFGNHLKNKELPIPQLVVHAVVAVVGFLVLLVGATV